MEIFLSAVLGDLTTRSINFFISKYSKPSALDLADRIRRVLLQAQVIIDEATGRHITNQAMLKQLDMLREAMHRGYYKLDTFLYQSHNRDQIIFKELQEVLDRLSLLILDANELVIFLKRYPRLYRQPCSMHLLLGYCMFGRHMEAELLINFLLHTQPRHAGGLEVLPIVGPGRVGKSTLVAHVCNDERVCDHFSELVFLNDDDFRDENLSVGREGCTMNKDGRLLVVVEVAGDLNEDAWKKFCSSKWCAASGAKIITTSRSDKIMKLGTKRALTLKYLSNEAYWYFFKILMFGNTDLDTHPKLAYMAMEMAKKLNRSFVAANIAACLLIDNFDIQFWRMVLAYLEGLIQKYVTKFGEHPCDVLNRRKAAHLGRITSTSEEIMIYRQYQCSSKEQVPKIMFHDVMYGSVKPHGKFEVLAWRSRIPPYYSYVYTCEIREAKTTGAKRKCSFESEVALC